MEAFNVRRQDNAGQAAMVDAILFMTVMLIASAVIIGSASSFKPASVEYSGLQQYAADYAETLLAMEISDINYEDAAGATVNISGSGKSISQLLCDEALILRESTTSNFSDYESTIFGAGKAIIRPGLDYAISCDEDSIFLSGSISSLSELPPNRCASQMIVFAGSGSSIIITVYVWVV
jgi:hypothetical protein